MYRELSKTELRELTKRVIVPDVEFNELWSICNKGFLYGFFEKNREKHLSNFFSHVNEIIGTKKNSIKEYNLLELNGEWLCYDPSSTMYDGVSEESTLGFFDSDDVPPPELWVCVDNDLLISFIPSVYLDIARNGVDGCVSGCLFWK